MTLLATIHSEVYHYGAMVRNEVLTEAVLLALEAWPLARRELATRAGVPNATLVKIANRRLGASEEVARRIVAALDMWQEEQRTAARQITKACRPIRRELRRAEDRAEETEE